MSFNMIQLIQHSSFLLLLLSVSLVSAYTPGNSGDLPFFSLKSYQRARAQETSKYLDASRFHFQILFVDDNNFHARISEGIFERLAEYNDALFTLFPSSATITASNKSPLDSAPSQEALSICDSLGLCSMKCAEFGTAFDISYLEDYDLIIAMNDDVQSRILSSLPSNSGFEQKCRSLNEFLSEDFYSSVVTFDKNKKDNELQNMMEVELWDRVQPFYETLKTRSTTNSLDVFSSDSILSMQDINKPRLTISEGGAAIPNMQDPWPVQEAGLLIGCAGLVRFCLDSMDAQFNLAFEGLMEKFFHREKDLNLSLEEADSLLRKGSFAITGYFSPKERKERIRTYFENLRSQFP